MRDLCIIRCRVSTATQAQNGESFETQENIGRQVAERYNADVDKVFRISISGRREDCLDDVINYIKNSRKKIKYLIVRNIDRLTRGGAGPYEKYKKTLADLGVSIIDSMGIIQPEKNTLEHLDIEYEWSKYSPSSSAELIIADQGLQEVRNILTRTIGREIELVRGGYHIGPIPDGYQVKKIYAAGKKSVLIPDKERSKYWIKIFEMRASGLYSDQEIADKINSMGFKTKERIK